jgi:D-glycero-alpha-D-manno-heptose-7-phosphate kinase
LLFYTATQRNSATIIEAQSKNVSDKKQDSIEAMHQLKRQANMMKESLLRGEVDDIGRILDFGFQFKKQMAGGISNDLIESLYQAAIDAGATGGKISGAGGGGFMTFYCPGTSRYAVADALGQFEGSLHPYQFTEHGLITWTM